MASTDYVKDPDATLDYIWDYSTWLPNNDTLVTVSFIASPGITINSQSNTSTNATAWISGGSSGQVYSVTCRITTAQGRIDDRTVTIRVTDR